MRVLVAGGSIGGLTTALLLRDLGYEVSIFERSSAALEFRRDAGRRSGLEVRAGSEGMIRTPMQANGSTWLTTGVVTAGRMDP